MNSAPIQPFGSTNFQACAATSQVTTSEDYHSSQVFIPRGNEYFDLQRLITTRKVAKVKNGHILSSSTTKDNAFPLWLRIPSDKPDNAFWTSTLKKDATNNKSTTAWIEWCRENSLRFWLGNDAAQFKVSETAKILKIDSFEKYENLVKNFPHAENDDYIDWERVATEFDAVHCTEDFCIPGWNCESTAWLNTDKLAFQKSISSEEIDL
ncbi:hypothetical protein [Endozoicomonas sp. 2B-B]